MANRQVQQLEHDGTRLFCPVHPNQQLDQTIQGTFMFICNAPVQNVVPGGSAVCARSAQWDSEKEMNAALAKKKSKPRKGKG